MSKNQMSREELLEAREKITRQLSVVVAHSSLGYESAKAELRAILREIEAELAEMGPSDSETARRSAEADGA